jgi:parallel beta-helix repeat protein
MCKAPMMFFGMVIVFAAFFTGNAKAITVEVGNCSSFPQYPTIQQAVSSVPAGATVGVCPGTYPEQVVITRNLTLKGLLTSSGSGATVVAPVTGIVANASSLASGSPIAAQVLVQGAAKVNISNLSVNGANSQINGCAPDLVGILYQNASGTINQVSVVNETLDSPDLIGCQSGLGIYVQSGILNTVSGTSTVKVTDSLVEDYQKNGITGNEQGTTLTVTGSYLVGHGSTTGAAENGIQFGFGATGSATTTTVTGDVWAPDTFSDTGDAAAGILIVGSQSVSLTSNNVSNNQYGIVTQDDLADGFIADHTLIKSNKVSGTHLFDGIFVCNNSSTIQSNTIFSSDESGIHIDSDPDDGCNGTGNGIIVSANVINTACTGILGNLSNNTIGTNTYYNVGSLNNPGNTCENVNPAVVKASQTKPLAKNHTSRMVRPVR